MHKYIVFVIMWAIFCVASPRAAHAQATLTCNDIVLNVWLCEPSFKSDIHAYTWNFTPDIGSFVELPTNIDDKDYQQAFQCDPLTDTKAGSQIIRQQKVTTVSVTWEGPANFVTVTKEIGCLSPGIGIEDTGVAMFINCHDGALCALWRFAFTATGATSPSQYRLEYQSYYGGPWNLKTVTSNATYYPHLGQNDLDWRVRGENALGYGAWTTFNTIGYCGGGGGGGGINGAPPGSSVTEILRRLGIEEEELAH